MADVLTLPPATHKQPSRKGKKAWRKNVDITEVQDGLENVRDEIIQGGVVSEKTLDELFVVDTAGDEQASKEQKTKKLLRADEILAVRSAVAGLDGRKRKAQELQAPTPASKRPKDGKYVSHKELQRLRSIADNEKEVSIEDTAAAHDPWAAPLPPKYADLDFVPQPQAIREPRGLRRTPVTLTASGKAIPSVRKPEGGKSYNPLVDDWSALLQREGAAAVELEKARLAAEALLVEKEAHALEEAAKADAAERAAYESDWDGFLSEGEREVFTAKQRPRKTPAERNKVKARKEREAKEMWERKNKARVQQESRVREIAKAVSARDRQRQALQVVADEDSSDSGGEPELRKRSFRKVPVPEAPLEVVLPEELQDSLRRLKPEGNLMTDRYRTMLINGKMEVRKRRGQAKQRRVDRTEKWSYKDWKLK